MDHNEEFDDGVRAMLGRVAAATVPTIGFTPDDVAAGGRERLRRRRVASVCGAAASVTAIAVAIGAAGGGFRSSHGGGTVSPGPSRTSGATTAPGTTTPHVPGPFGNLPAAEVQATHQALATLMADLRASSDPEHRHLSQTASDVSDRTGGDGNPDGITASALWTADGGAKPPQGSAPYVEIQFDIDGPGVSGQLGPYGSFSQNDAPAPWQHKDSQRLSDGSTVTWASTVLQSGTEMAAERDYPDGRKVTIHVTDASGWPQATAGPAKPFPFTTAALVAAVSDPSLKLPSFP